MNMNKLRKERDKEIKEFFEKWDKKIDELGLAEKTLTVELENEYDNEYNNIVSKYIGITKYTRKQLEEIK